MSLKDYRKALLTFINFPAWKNPVAITLTFKQVFHSVAGSIRLTSEHAAKNVRHFLNQLNRRYFGNASKRFGKGIPTLPVLEVSREGRLHYHLLMDRPTHIDPVHFQSDIRSIWKSTDWGYDQIHIDTNPNEGWIYYITKYSQKPEYTDAIDFLNCHKA
jgi:hypothetical protein